MQARGIKCEAGRKREALEGIDNVHLRLLLQLEDDGYQRGSAARLLMGRSVQAGA